MTASRGFWAPLLLALACGPDTISMGYDIPVTNLGTMPSGPAYTCYGDGCPYGECDNDDFFTDVDCDDVYPGPVDDDALFCQPVVEADYCLSVGPSSLETTSWLIQCGGDVATATRCASGCSHGSSEGGRCL
jgi:hypothetical protein